MKEIQLPLHCDRQVYPSRLVKNLLKDPLFHTQHSLIWGPWAQLSETHLFHSPCIQNRNQSQKAITRCCWWAVMEVQCKTHERRSGRSCDWIYILVRTLQPWHARYLWWTRFITYSGIIRRQVEFICFGNVDDLNTGVGSHDGDNGWDTLKRWDGWKCMDWMWFEGKRGESEDSCVSSYLFGWILVLFTETGTLFLVW